MHPRKKRFITAIAVSLLLHAAVIGLLAILVLTAANPEEKNDDGIPVLLGDVPDAGGMDIGGLPEELAAEEETTVTEESVEPEPAAEESEAEEMPISQTREETIDVKKREEDAKRKAEAEKKRKEEEAKRKAEEEAKRKAEAEKKRKEEEAKRKAEAEKKRKEEEAKRKAEEERKRKEAEDKRRREEAAAAAANSAMSGAFGNKNNSGSSGYTTGNGSQGSTTGNSNIGALTGVGGFGNAQGLVGSRRLVSIDRPSVNDPAGNGSVVFEVTVNESGVVTNATIKKTGNFSAETINRLRAAVLKAKFTRGTQIEKGTITFPIKMK